MKNTFVVATTGEFAGQTGRVITSHTYAETGLHYSVRFASGSLWMAAADVRPASAAEIRAAEKPRPLRPAA